MRNPNRISIILEKLNDLWQKYPDLRFGQLCIIMYTSEDKIFFTEDEKLEERVDELIKDYVYKGIRK